VTHEEHRAARWALLRRRAAGELTPAELNAAWYELDRLRDEEHGGPWPAWFTPPPPGTTFWHAP
jgi:hypothetical protein